MSEAIFHDHTKSKQSYLPQCQSKASQPYKTTGKNMVVYILISKFFLDSRRETIFSWLTGRGRTPN